MGHPRLFGLTASTVDGRVGPRPRRNWQANSFPWSPPDFSPDSPAASGAGGSPAPSPRLRGEGRDEGLGAIRFASMGSRRAVDLLELHLGALDHLLGRSAGAGLGKHVDDHIFGDAF